MLTYTHARNINAEWRRERNRRLRRPETGKTIHSILSCACYVYGRAFVHGLYYTFCPFIYTIIYNICRPLVRASRINNTILWLS